MEKEQNLNTPWIKNLIHFLLKQIFFSYLNQIKTDKHEENYGKATLNLTDVARLYNSRRRKKKQ